MMRTLLALALPLLAPLAALHAAEFHISPLGADTNPGTRAKPFATLERAGDVILIQGYSIISGKLIDMHPEQATWVRDFIKAN